MKLIIEIPEEVYNVCKQYETDKCATWSECVIANGVPYCGRPKGKWIADDEWGNCHCSVCNFENNHQPDFCENCGANMVADLCSICKHGDNCERSDKGISFANHSVCWKFER